MVRRRVLVRRSKIVGLGKEANRIEAGRVLGQAAVGGKAKTYVDWKRRLLAMGRNEARARSRVSGIMGRGASFPDGGAPEIRSP
jgi:hypothetical protein